METTPKLGITFPGETEDPFVVSYFQQMADLDDWMFANVEDKNRVLIGELSLDSGTDTLSWTDLVLASLTQTGVISIDADSIELLDGDFAYVVVSRPYATDTLEIATGTPPLLNRDAVPLAYRSGDELFVLCGSTGSGGGAPVVDGEGVYFIDPINGDDVDGEGTSSAPWASLGHACLQVPPPGDYATFSKPVFFNIAPGTDPGNAVLPYRLHISIIGEGVLYTGNIHWGYDTAHWDGNEDLSTLTLMASSWGTFRFTGTLTGVNDVPANGHVWERALYCYGLPIEFAFHNRQTEDATNWTGDVYAFLHGASFPYYDDPPTANWGGESEINTATKYRNTIEIYAYDTELYANFFGNVIFSQLSNCMIAGDVDYTLRAHDSNPGYEGAIGTLWGLGLEAVTWWGWNTFKFGWIGSGTANPYRVKMDSYTYWFNFDYLEYENITLDFVEHALGINVDNSGWAGILAGVETAQEAFDIVDGLVIPSTYVTGFMVIYVDAVNGSDGSGDGSATAPYQTFPYACAQVPDPGSIDVFTQIVAFELAPGVYSGTAVLPYRATVTVTGHNAIITGDIRWLYDKYYLFGVSPTLVPLMLQINSADNGAILFSGELSCYNITPANGTIDRTLWMDRVATHFDLLNMPSGGTVAGQETGTLTVNMSRCFPILSESLYPAPDWGGMFEPAIANQPNMLVINAFDSELNFNLYGCSYLNARSCILSGDIDYSVNPNNGAAGYLGTIGMRAHDFQIDGNPTLKLGWNGSSPEDPVGVILDANSYPEILALTPTMDNIDYELLDQAIGVELDQSTLTGIAAEASTVQGVIEIIDDRWSGSIMDVTVTSGTKIIKSIPIVEDTTVMLEMTLVAWNADSLDETKCWKIYGLVQNNGGTTTVKGTNIDSIITTALGAESSWDVDLVANDTTDVIEVTVTGDSGGDVVAWQLQYAHNTKVFA